jgi:hypothetical protein
MISPEEACRRYQMSEEEFHTWQRALETYGINGLRATALQQYRSRTTMPASKEIHCGKILIALGRKLAGTLNPRLFASGGEIKSTQ